MLINTNELLSHMKRKINKVGHNTMTISLPSEWVKQNNLTKGDELEVKEDGRQLIVGCDNKKKEKDIHIHVKSHEEFMGRLITGPYIIGYNSIKITYEDSKVYEKILRSSNKILGFEIIEMVKTIVN